MTPADVIRGVVAEYNTYTPDEIAAKLSAEGMLWCSGPYHNRAWSCPMHHLFMARLGAAGVRLDPGNIEVSGLVTEIWAGHDNPIPAIRYGDDSSIEAFIAAYDQDEYEHLESGP